MFMDSHLSFGEQKIENNLSTSVENLNYTHDDDIT